MVRIENQTKGIAVDFPTSIDEITKEYFDGILNGIKLQEHYCVIALCFKDKVSNIALALKDKSNPIANITPVIAKIPEGNECGFRQMEKVVIDRTNLERGVHLGINRNFISVSGFENLVKGNNTLINSLANSSYWRDKGMSISSPNIYLVEFKIVPIRDIIATRALDVAPYCIYVHNLDEANSIN